jgi:hypothetical protein
MRDIVMLRVKPDVCSFVLDAVELLYDLVPGCIGNVLEDDDGGLMLLDVVEHAEEGTSCARVESRSARL